VGYLRRDYMFYHLTGILIFALLLPPMLITVVAGGIHALIEIIYEGLEDLIFGG